MNIKRSLFAGLFAFAFQVCTAQTSKPDIVATASGNSSNVSGSLNWTVGEPLIETGSSTNNFLTQGFQQPPGIAILSVNRTNNQSGGKISAYPNPVSSSVYITSSINQPLKVDVMDLTGRKMFSKNLSGNDDNIVNMADYSNGIYLFKVYSTDGQLLQTLKIDKIK
jgi:hypothetical protein